MDRPVIDPDPDMRSLFCDCGRTELRIRAFVWRCLVSTNFASVVVRCPFCGTKPHPLPASPERSARA